jgi:hypothetical protein
MPVVQASFDLTEEFYCRLVRPVELAVFPSDMQHAKNYTKRNNAARKVYFELYCIAYCNVLRRVVLSCRIILCVVEFPAIATLFT